MIQQTLKLAACACCAIVALSFVMFARDEIAAGSQHQTQELASSSAPATHVPAKPKSQPRRFIDGAAHDLTSPFDSVVASDSAWVSHGVPTVLALLVYGVGLGYAARFTSGLS